MAALLSFFEWLEKQKSQRTPIGEFARSASRDAKFPRDLASLDALLEYVRSAEKSSAESVAVARTAYRAYERSVKPASRI